MIFQDATVGRWGGGYERLARGEETANRPRRFRMKRRIKGVKIPRSRKLNWKPFWMTFMLSKKISRICAEFVKRLKMDECPAIAFSCNWGLPVLTHSYDRSLTWY